MSEFDFNLEQIPFGTDNFAANPEPRCPVVLLLDRSASMAGEPIAQLNAGLVTFKDELMADQLAAKRVEISIVTFGPVEIQNEFLLAHEFSPPTLTASGDTPMGAAITQGIDLLQARKSIYRANGISYYRPWLFLITDGGPTDYWQTAATQVHEGEKAKAFSFYTVAVANANIEVLNQIAVPHRQPQHLKGLQFRPLFVWLSNSVRAVSGSAPGDVVRLTNPATPDGWAEA
jgi:uncharacterized protein YegL